MRWLLLMMGLGACELLHMPECETYCTQSATEVVGTPPVGEGLW